jgi:RNA polymerase sigma-70 factor (ECF subfamily)
VPDTPIRFGFDSYSGSAPDVDPCYEERRLLDSLRAGTEEAYEEFINKYQQPVYNLVYRLMDDPSDAADVVQEVFLKVFRGITSFRGNSSLKTWVYRIACNEAYNQRRWFTRHKRQEVAFETECDHGPNLHDLLPDPGRSAFEMVYDRETRAMIETALSEVNPAFRAAVILRDIEELSYEEIAEILQVSLGTVKSRILRGREALKKGLVGRLNSEPAIQLTPQPAR